MSEQPIRDAATLVIVDDDGAEPRVLLGRRRADLVFLPNVFVFPGGRVDGDDADAPSVDELDADEQRLLACGREGGSVNASAIRGLALAAVRETFEETGLIVGSPLAAGPSSPAPVVPPAWAPFAAQGYGPRLAPLRYVLRAITPPARPRRYDTRFFMVNAREIAHRGTAIDDELSELGWFTMTELGTLDVPLMTRIAIDELAAILRQGLAPASQRQIPFYFEEDGIRRRVQLSLVPACP